jgi:hypothetical protein
MRLRSFVLISALTLAIAPTACGGADHDAGSGGASSAAETTAVTTTSAGGGGVGGSGGAGGGAPDPTAICAAQGLESLPFAEGPYGPYRGDLAGDFTLPLVDGTTFDFRAGFSGCESYLFIPDRIAVSDLDSESIWEQKDLDDLVEDSPPNVHYFFVSRQSAVDAANESTQAMQQRVVDLLGTLEAADAEHWAAHLHVVAGRAKDLESWIGDVLSGHGVLGFGVDRDQRVRGVGYLADVHRYSQSLANAGYWPWKNNLAYVANEASYFNAQAEVTARLRAEDAKVVTLWDGEILQEFADTTVDLPPAEEMAGYDTFEVDVTMACPDIEAIEFNNCGPWDYLAYLFVKDAEGNDVQLARFITSYHRETHWVVDASAMLPHLREGGSRQFRWSFAPPWNPQPTSTKLSLRFSNRNKGYTPGEATFLWGGAAFGSAYNDARLPADVPIPADAKRVELWAIITGHGADEATSCAEFCNHQHEFTVGESVYMKEYPEAGTADECVPQLAHGMVPNQGGTWWFGRGGWCPGQQVDPWVVDVTGDVTPGQTATVSYRGLYHDATPPDGSATIDLISYLVVYR